MAHGIQKARTWRKAWATVTTAVLAVVSSAYLILIH